MTPLTYDMRPCDLISGLRWSLTALIIGASLPVVAQAQGDGPSDPAPSAMIKSTINKTDPIKLLLDRKKQLDLSKAQEDTLKAWGKEMHHMQDLVYSEIDKAAKKDRDNQKQGDAPKPRGGAVSDDVQERIKRLQDIQSAYRDRAHGLLTAGQRAKADSADSAKHGKDEKKP